MSWTDIENTLKNGIQSSPGETDTEKLAYFKGKILAHLDNLQAEEDKKILPFPKTNQAKKGVSRMEEITLKLDDENFHYVLRQYGLEGAKKMALSMALKQYSERPITEAMLYSCLASLESDLAGMFS